LRSLFIPSAVSFLNPFPSILFGKTLIIQISIAVNDFNCFIAAKKVAAHSSPNSLLPIFVVSIKYSCSEYGDV